MTGEPKEIRLVWWEDDPYRRRVVKRCCPVCYPNGEHPHEVCIQVVSRVGVAHRGSEYGMTECGRNATGRDWWWAS